MSRFLSLVALFALLLTASPAAAAEKTTLVVNTYGGNYQSFFEKVLIPEFTKQYPNVEIKLATGLSKDWTAEIRASGKDKAPYDVVMLNEIWASQIRREGYFLPLDIKRIPNMKDVIITHKDETGKETLSVVAVIQPIGIAYRTDLVKNPPKSWKEIWNPEYKGKFGTATLTNAMGALFVMTAAQIFYDDATRFEDGILKIAELKPFKQTDFSGDMEKLLSLGEVEVAVLDAPMTKRIKKKGVPVDWIAPEEFVTMFDQVISIHKATKNREMAENWVNFLLSPDIQNKFVRQFLTTPAVRGIEIPAELRDDVPVDQSVASRIPSWNWNAFNDQKIKLIRFWNQKINR